MEDLQIVEHVVRKDPKVIEQCVLSGIPKEDMHKVYCDREFLLHSRFHSPFAKRLMISMDNWLRPPIRQQRSFATSPHVLPSAHG